jgi:glutaredoxin 3
MKEISVYSTPTCPWCVKVKAYLKSKNVKFNDYDVAQNAEKRNEMLEKTGQMGVPVIDIGGEVIIGFDQQAIDAALKG